MKPFLFGLAPHIDDSGILTSEVAYNRVGDNTGNLAFCYAINRLLGGDLESIPWHASASAVHDMGDIGVLTMANQLGSHANFGKLAEQFADLSCKLVGIGLGAQAGNMSQEVSIPEGTLKWVESIQERSPTDAANIALRGQFTQDALRKYGLAEKTVVLGCPTLFINPNPALGRQIAEKFRQAEPKFFAVAAGHQRWGHLAKIEASLVQIAHDGGAYICQSPLQMVKLGRGEAAELSQEDRDQCRTYATPHLTDEEFVKWSRKSAVSLFSAAAWLEYMRRFDFVIGTRIHGVMLALQAGVPGLCIAHDSRTTELCETMKVPYVPASAVSGGLKRDDISKLFVFDEVEFDNNRRRLAQGYMQFFENNSLKAANYLANIATTGSDE